MSPKSKSFAWWLGVISSITGIVGFLVQIGFAPILDPLKKTIGLPIWLIIFLAALLLLGASKVLNKGMTRLVEKCDGLEKELQGARADKQAMERALSSLKSAGGYRQVAAKCSEELARYEALEQEILGLLGSGQEMNLTEITEQTSVSLQPDRRQLVTRALAALGDRVGGTGGRYRLLPRSQDAQQVRTE